MCNSLFSRPQRTSHIFADRPVIFAMDRLPVEMLTSILSHLSLSSLFVSMSVCQKWKAVTQNLIRTQTSLELRLERGMCPRNGLLPPDCMFFRMDDEQLVSNLENCLKYMSSVRECIVHSKSYIPDISPIVLFLRINSRNMEHLTWMITSGDAIMSESWTEFHRIVFRNLTEYTGWIGNYFSFTSSCPAVTKLTLEHQKCWSYHTEVVDYNLIELSKLKNLQQIRICKHRKMKHKANAGILCLLQGESRFTLRVIEVSLTRNQMDGIDMHAVDNELDQIHAVTGVRPQVIFDEV
jgi:hypothetical protein